MVQDASSALTPFAPPMRSNLPLLSDGRPGTLEFVTLDERLALAARREGFLVLPV